MKHLNSELINKYIDNELDESEVAFVYKHLSECQTCQNEVTYTKKMVANLHKSQVYPSLDFSKTVMTKIKSANALQSKIKNFFSFENNLIIVCVLFLVSIFAINFLSEGNQTTKEPSIISNFTSSIVALSSDVSSKATNTLTTIVEEKIFLYFALGMFSLLFFLVVDQIIVSQIRYKKSKKEVV
jgi:predicted anti-sigma-YlaC factor YlaD